MYHYSRLLNLSSIKHAFLQSGVVDWHVSPQLNDTTHSHDYPYDYPHNHLHKHPDNHQHNSLDNHLHNHPDDHEDDSDTVLAPARLKLKPPPLYAVVLLNDDYTPMDCVIEILQQYFALNLDQATEVMLTVHYEGKGVAGVYARDIAETKANQVNHYARSQGYPLLCMIEPRE